MNSFDPAVAAHIRALLASMSEDMRETTMAALSIAHPAEVEAVRVEFAQRAARSSAARRGPRTFVNDCAVPHFDDDDTKGEALTHFTIRHLDLMRKLLDEVATGTRHMLVALVACGKFVELRASRERPRRWYAVDNVNRIYMRNGKPNSGIPTTRVFERTETLLIRGDATPIMAAEGDFVVGADKLLGSLKAMTKHDSAANSAEELLNLLKSFEHRGLLVNPTLHKRLAAPATVARIRGMIANVLKVDLITSAFRNPANKAHQLNDAAEVVAEAQAGVKRSLGSCGRLLDALLTVSQFVADPAEQAAHKLRVLRRHLCDPDSRSHGKAREIVSIVIGSRFGLGHRAEDGGEGQGSSRSASSDSTSDDISADNSSESSDTNPGSDPEADAAADTTADATSNVEAQGLSVRVARAGGDSYSLPDAFSVYNVDVLSRCFDLFTLAMSDLFNDQDLDIWPVWRNAQVFRTKEEPIYVGQHDEQPLKVPVLDNRYRADGSEAPKFRIEDELRWTAGGDIRKIAPAFDPLKITNFVLYNEVLFPGVSAEAERVIAVRMSLTHQSNIHAKWSRGALFEFIKDLNAIVSAAQDASGASPARVSLTRFRHFVQTVTRSYIPFANRLHSLIPGRGTIPTMASLLATLDVCERHLASNPESQEALVVRTCTGRFKLIRSSAETRRAPPGKQLSDATFRNAFSSLLIDDDDDDEDDDDEEEEEEED
jgi:hypothetical protein